MISHVKPIQTPGAEGGQLSQLEWSAPTSGGVPQCLGRGREVQGRDKDIPVVSMTDSTGPVFFVILKIKLV